MRKGGWGIAVIPSWRRLARAIKPRLMRLGFAPIVAGLLARLRQGDISACLDTYEVEPLPPRHPLPRLTNVFLTPHIAGGSPDMLEQSVREVAAKVCRILAGDLAGNAEVGETPTRRP